MNANCCVCAQNNVCIMMTLISSCLLLNLCYGEVMTRRLADGSIETTTRVSTTTATTNADDESISTTSVGVTSDLLFHVTQPIDIYESSILSDKGNRLLLGQGYNLASGSLLGVIDLANKPTGQPLWSIVDTQLYAVRPDHNVDAHFFGILSTNDVFNGSMVYQYSRLYGPLDSRDNQMPTKFINYSVPGDETAISGGAMSGNGKIFVAAVNHPQTCVVEIVHLGGAVMIKHVKMAGVACAAPCECVCIVVCVVV
jgi:hypothetical protein